MSRSIVKALWGAIARSMALLFFMILLLGAEPAQAKKIALVLGNQQYTNIAQLNNPENDARDIAQALRSLQFELVGKNSAGDGGPVLNEDLLGMTKALTRFGREAADADLALVFYAGHGATIDGESYLLPVNALSPLEGGVLSEAHLQVLKSNSLALKQVIAYMDGVKGAKIAIFDACREVLNLKQRALLGSSGNTGALRGGLIPPGGNGNQLLIAFSGASGQLVQDGTGRNSPYTAVLLEEMQQPAQRDIMSFFSDVAAKSGERLGGSVASQTPEVIIRGLRSGRFFLGESGGSLSSVPKPDLVVPGKSEAPFRHKKDDLSQMLFLRGQFAWWDALPEYKVKPVGSDLYMSSVELTADGQPYEFKFADLGWSSGTNCGATSKADQNVTLGSVSNVNCNAVFDSFSFLPPHTGTYRFFFDNSGKVPLVYVKAAE